MDNNVTSSRIGIDKCSEESGKSLVAKKSWTKPTLKALNIYEAQLGLTTLAADGTGFTCPA
jgi:hypothetical protein